MSGSVASAITGTLEGCAIRDGPRWRKALANRSLLR